MALGGWTAGPRSAHWGAILAVHANGHVAAPRGLCCKNKAANCELKCADRGGMDHHICEMRTCKELACVCRGDVHPGPTEPGPPDDPRTPRS